MPITLLSSNIIVEYASSNIIFDTVKSMGNYNVYFKDPTFKKHTALQKFTSEEQFPKSAPVGLPTSPNDGQQNFNFNLSAVIDSNNYSTYMNTISTGTYNTANTTVGFSQIIDGNLYEFRTNHCGEANGKWYEVLDNNKANNWYIQYYNWMSGTIYNQYAYNNHDTTLLSDGTMYNGIWLEIGTNRKMILKKYSWSLNDDSIYRNQRKPVIWLICGSNDRNMWTPIHNVPNEILYPDTIPDTPSNQTDIFFQNFKEPLPYKYFRWIIRKLSTYTWFATSTFKLYGHEYIEPPTIKTDTVDSKYKYIVFRNTGENQTHYSITFPEETQCDILIVGGGGSGGTRDGGGGGAGGIIFSKNVIIPNGTYDIKVGNGGDSVKAELINGNDGYSSSFLGAVALGGGGGGRGETAADDPNGRNGGSGGGGGYDDPYRYDNYGSTIQSIDKTTYGDLYNFTSDKDNDIYIYGNNGGYGYKNTSGIVEAIGGGGGGAGAVGFNGNSSVNKGRGGIGINLSSTFGTDVGVNGYFGGGGGGGGDNTGGLGGLGGGGRGGGSITGGSLFAEKGYSDTGGGGGGGGGVLQLSGNYDTYYSGAGGSGVVIIRYLSLKDNIDFEAQWTYSDDNGYTYNIGNVGIGTYADNTKALTVNGNLNYNGNLYKNNLLISHGKKYIQKNIIEINKPFGYSKYKTEKMYPPVRNLNSGHHLVSGKSYGNGVYVVTESDSYDGYRNGYSAFNISINTGPHFNANYNAVGVYIGDKKIVNGYNGDWIIIKMPTNIKLTKYELKQRDSYENYAPGQYKIYGSNDGINWTELVSKTSTIIYVGYIYKERVVTSNLYNHFGIVVNKLVGNATNLVFDEWYIYGKELDYTNNQVDNFHLYNKQILKQYTILDNDNNSLLLWLKLDGDLLDSSKYNHTLYKLLGNINYYNNNIIGKKYLKVISDAKFVFNLQYKIIPDGTKKLTFCYWIRNDDGSGNIFRYQPSTGDLIIIGSYSDGYIYKFKVMGIEIQYNNSSKRFAIYKSDKWNHLVFTADLPNKKMKAYINGIDITDEFIFSDNGDNLASGFSNSKIYESQKFVFLNSTAQNSVDAFSGDIYDLRIYNRILTSIEINALVNNYTMTVDSDIITYNPQSNLAYYDYPVLDCDTEYLLAHYKFDGDFKDSSGNNNHMNILYSYNGKISTTSANKIYGYESLNSYNELNYRIELPTSIDLRYTDFTISLWFYIDERYRYNNQDIIKFKNGSTNMFYLYIRDNGYRLHTIWNGPRGESSTNQVGNIPGSSSTQGYAFQIKQWNHYAFVLTKTEIREYINGELIERRVKNVGHYNKTFTTIFIGKEDKTAFSGNLDDFRIYNKALSEREISILADGKIKDDYKLLTFKHSYISRMQSYAEYITGVNGWIMVKYKPVSLMWWSGNDNLQGNYRMNEGTCLETEEWATTWDDSIYDELLFVKGDFVSWLRVTTSSLDLTGWRDSPALGGNKLTNGNFKYYRDSDNSYTGTYATSPYIWDHQVPDWNNSYGHMIYQEHSEFGFYGVPGDTWPDNNDYNKYPPEEYKYYVFVRKSSDITSYSPNHTEYTLTFNEPKLCDILLVGGGGGGGKYGGGGGGGDVQYFSNVMFHADEYTIIVGNGGQGSNTYGNLNQNARNGYNSEIYIKGNNTPLYIAAGGGGGSSWDGGDTNNIDPMTKFIAVNNESTGGGGGGSTTHIYESGGNSIISLYSGNGGAAGKFGDNVGSNDICVASGGGGGGGKDGENGQSAYMDDTSNSYSKSGKGGNGTASYITGNKVYYGGGGGGGGKGGSGTIENIRREIIEDGRGGLGGGGNGSDYLYNNYGINHTGGGGGGGSANNGGYGGSGIIIIRYKAKYTYQYNDVKEWTYNKSNICTYHLGNVGIGTTFPENALDVNGTITGYSKNFKIKHPLGKNMWLYHGSVEGSRYDNIYRGKKILKNGFAEVLIDKDCNDNGGMSIGTFKSLNTNCQLFLQNNQTYDNIRGTINDGIITIVCENTEDEIEIDWLVVAERYDKDIKKSNITNDRGNLICEHNMGNNIGSTKIYVTNSKVSGLYWEFVGILQPKRGVPLINNELSKALETKLEFTEDEWIQFNINNLRQDNYVKSCNKYYKPVAINNEIV